jgi:hypothetical protein
VRGGCSIANVVAVHEVGHALARYLTAEAQGFEADEATRGTPNTNRL